MPRPMSRSSSQGFTLLEMMVVTVIAAIALAGVWEYSVFQKRVGQNLSERIEYQSHTARIMNFLGNDIARAGYGLMEVPGTATPKMSEIRANEMALSLLDNNDHPSTNAWLNSMASLAGVVPVPGADQLVMGATVYADSRVTRKMAVVLQDSGATFASVYHMEGAPYFVPGDRFFAMAPTTTSINAGSPADVNLNHQVYTITSVDTAVGSGLSSMTARRLVYTNGAALATPLPKGSELYGMDPTTYTASGNLQRFTKIQYALVQSGRTLTGGAQLGNLVRYRFKGAGEIYTTTNVESIVIAEDILDFQVQALVWPCTSSATAAQWVNQPDAAIGGFRDMGLFSPEVNSLTSAFVNRRMRILGVRVLVFAAAEVPVGGKGVHDVHLPQGVTSFQVGNRLLTGLDSDRHYILHEAVYDPINFRFRDEQWLINDSAINALIMDGTSCQIVR